MTMMISLPDIDLSAYDVQGEAGAVAAKRWNATEPGKAGQQKGSIDDVVGRAAHDAKLTALFGPEYNPNSAAYVVNIVPMQPYSGYPNVSRLMDIVTTGDKVVRDLGTDAVYGWCFNGSGVIELNTRTLIGNLEQFQRTERHELRHRLHGISDSNPIGNYIMRALDATAMWEKGVYDRVQAYRQHR